MTSLAGTTGAAEPPLCAAARSPPAACWRRWWRRRLFWQQRPGLSLFVFFVLLIAGVLALHRRGQTLLLAAAAVAAALPLLEAPSLRAADGDRWRDAAGAGSRRAATLRGMERDGAGFAVLAPLRLVADGLRLLRDGVSQKPGGRLWRAIVAWLVPLGLAAVFVLLFTAANPLLERGFRALQVTTSLSSLRPGRVVLWGVLPFSPSRSCNRCSPAGASPCRCRGRCGTASCSARRRYATRWYVQPAVRGADGDGHRVPVGRVRLPDGMSHAEYAHRGAYPLIATAILAGAFVLVAMRADGRPGARRSSVRWSMCSWRRMGLVASSLLRLRSMSMPTSSAS